MLTKELEQIFNAVSTCHGARAYVVGDWVLSNFDYMPNELNFLVLLDANKKNDDLYNHLTKKITINEEIQNSATKYIVLSKPYVLNFSLFNTSINDAIASMSNFTIEGIIYDIKNKTVINLLNAKNEIELSKDINQWTTLEILKLAQKYGNIKNISTGNELREALSSIDLLTIKKSDDHLTVDLFIELILTRFPGTALKFLKTSFVNGSDWVIENILELIIKQNIQIDEKIDIYNLINSDKLEIIDIYNEYILHNRQEPESSSDMKRRLSTTLSLLLDNQPMPLDMPYIGKVFTFTEAESHSKSTVMNSSLSTTRVFAEPGDCPPYGCPECIPAECDPPCCCCHSVDIISQIKLQCHKQIVLSCNAAGDGPGPDPCNGSSGDGCFPDECDICRDACDIAIAGSSSVVDCAIDDQTWWSLPPKYSPCDCSCREGFERSDGTCDLTCVTCNDYFCESEIRVDVTSECNYNFFLSPSSGCCGVPATVDWMFVIDRSASMGPEFDDVRNEINILVDALEAKGAVLRVGLAIFGTNCRDTEIVQPLTTDIEQFKTALASVIIMGGTECDIEAVIYTVENAGFGTATANYMMLIADEYSQYSNNALRDTLINNAKILLADHNITLFVIDGGGTNAQSPDRLNLAVSTGATPPRFNLDAPFSDVVNNLQLTVFPASCDCLETGEIPIRKSSQNCICCADGITSPCIDDPFDVECLDQLRADHPECFDISIRQCVPGQDCSSPDFCKQETALNVCGSTIVITPERINMVCCSLVGSGCQCVSTLDCDDAPCCGPTCPETLVCDQSNNQNTLLYPDTPNGRRLAKQEVWCNCFTLASFVDSSTPACNGCCCPDPSVAIGDPDYPCALLDPTIPEQQQLLQNGTCCNCAEQDSFTPGQINEGQRRDCCECCLHFADGVRDPTTGECGFNVIKCKPEIDAEVDQIFDLCGQGGGGGGGGEPPAPWSCHNMICPENDEIISGNIDNCSATHNPSVVVLNNGIGLVAYENHTNNSTIMLKQFKTSVLNKFLSHRVFNFGRLEHYSKWQDNIAKLYFYEEIPTELLTVDNTINPADPTTWSDGVAFQSGPLGHLCFPISPPVETDEIGDYLKVIIPEGTSFTEEWSSNDDVYNVQWLLFDFEDSGLIGCDSSNNNSNYRCNDSEVANFESLISQSAVDQELLLSPHIYNSNQVPIANPYLACAQNYSNAAENSQMVYLTYQALEDNKWNIYLRQIRLSEYSRQELINEKLDELVQISDLNISHAVYRIVCVNDNCDTYTSSSFLVKRSLIAEILLPDGREIYNNGYTGYWSSLCPGFSATDFPKRKVYVQLAHAVVTDRCPDQFGFDEIFYDWQAGQEYSVPLSPITAHDLLDYLHVEGDTSISIGTFTPPAEVGEALISSSSISVVWYDDPNIATWATVSDESIDELLSLQGLQIGEPVLLTPYETGHCTRPRVKVNYRNDVFVVYEYIDDGISQIRIIGTAEPETALPTGYLTGNNIDEHLNNLLNAADFSYSHNISQHGDGINQSPDIYIDMNDNIHVAWQSNRDGYWEIYYANATQDFSPTRITEYKSKSLKPSISGTSDGRLFIVWHDNRFGNYEIMIAYNAAFRILPLHQQDPYLASLRNFSAGWKHATTTIPLLFENNSAESQCYKNFSVNFYYDRLLENLAFQVSARDYPFAFTLPTATQDTSQFNLSSEGDWQEIRAPVYEDPYTIIAQVIIRTRNEFDTFLEDSLMQEITLPSFGGECVLLTIQFRASNIKSDPLASTQWTAEIDISGREGDTVALSELGVAVTGRYQQVRIKYQCSTITESYFADGNNDDADLKNDIEWDNNNVALRLGLDGSDFYDAYLRFAINVPKNATILDANLKLMSFGDYDGHTSSIIRLIDDDDVDEFPNKQIITSSINSSKSDTYSSNFAVGENNHTSTILQFGQNGASTESWLRFPLDIPKSSLISQAYLTMVPAATVVGIGYADLWLINKITCPEFPTETQIDIPLAARADDVIAQVFFPYPETGYYPYPDTIGTLKYVSDGDVRHLLRLPLIDSSGTELHFYNLCFRFDLSFLASQASVASAVLRLYALNLVGEPVNRLTVTLLDYDSIPDFSNHSSFGGLLPDFFNFTDYPLIVSPAVVPYIVDISGSDLTNLLPSPYPDFIDINITDIVNAYKGRFLTWAYIGLQVNIYAARPFYGNIFNIAGIDYTDAFGNPDPTKTPRLILEGESFPDILSSISWTVDTWAMDTSLQSVDISNLVSTWLTLQNDGYTSGNFIGFMIDGISAARSFYSYDNGTNIPSLTVVYNLTKPNTTTDGIIWTPSSWSQYEIYDSPSIANLVQSYVDRDNYEAGNHIGLVLENNNSLSLRSFVATDDSSYNYSSELEITYSLPHDWSVLLKSLSPPRICLMAGNSTTGTLDLTPQIRVNQDGTLLSETPLPINHRPNWTYFTEVEATEDDGTTIKFSNQKQSASCEKCYEKTMNWNETSCSVFISLLNETEDVQYYNISIKFYKDSQYQILADEINTTDHISAFSSNNSPASGVKTQIGFQVLSGETLDISCWPTLSNSTGLLCGITYYLRVEYCVSVSTECTNDSMILLDTKKWICDCESVRWDDVIEDAPVNLRSLTRWRSSAAGYSDTRLTETIGVNNTNPIICFRNNLNGIVIYESNRSENADEITTDYKIYASVFSILTSYDMYASATESIFTGFQELYHRSDIPVCPSPGCFDEYGKPENATATGLPKALRGRSPAVAIDQYDGLFLAIEQPVITNTECNELKFGQQQSILVHRCGIDPLKLFGQSEQDLPVVEPCKPTTITGTTQIGSLNSLFITTVRKLRVKKEDVAYQVTRGSSPTPVVTKCNITLEVIGTPEVVAVRLQNKTTEPWSEWKSFSPTIGENTMEIPWNLSSDSGLKTVFVQFATYAGLAVTSSISIIADYQKINYSVYFYKSVPGTTPLPGSSEDATFTIPDENSEVWSIGNKVLMYNSIPVTSLRPVETDSAKNIVIHQTDYIFFEIIPDNSYLESIKDLSNISPTVDFVQQGRDQLNIPTFAQSKDGKTVFRGKAILNKDGESDSLDGLAYLLPHFVNDCSDSSVVDNPADLYSSDSFNLISKQVQQSNYQTDIWKTERDNVGLIKHLITIRPNEDPYMIFGDPNYRFP